jgi:hypothetical protein
LLGWSDPFLTALSSTDAASALAVLAASISPEAIAFRVRETMLFAKLLVALFLSAFFTEVRLAFSLGMSIHPT